MFAGITAFAKHKPGLTMGFLLAVSSLLLGMWVAALPAIKLRLGLTDGSLGLSLLLSPVGSLTGVVLASWLFSRVKVGKWLLAGPAIQSILFIGMVTVQHRLVFWILLFATGLIGFFNGVSINAVIDTIEKKYQRRIMSSCHGMYSLGGGVSIGLAAIFYSLHIAPLWQIVFVASCILLTLAGIRHHLLVHKLYIHSGSSLAAPPLSVIGLAFICFVSFMGEGSIADWSAIYMKESLHSSIAMAGLGYGGFSVMMAIGRFNGDAWIPRVGAKKIVIAGTLVAATGFLLATAFPFKATAIAGFSLVGLGYACVVPILFSAAANVPGISPAVGISSIASGGLIGFLFGPSVIGMVAEKFTLAAGLSVVLVLNCIAAYVATRNRFLATDSNAPYPER
ncbi:MAG TPA: MFS transporter [Chitinophagaceae bacterium]|nr:MFS transporter [Chitinophagaceae bacterium]